jgi:hypothetical protein
MVDKVEEETQLAVHDELLMASILHQMGKDIKSFMILANNDLVRLIL